MLKIKAMGAQYDMVLALPFLAFIYFLRHYHPWFYIGTGSILLIGYGFLCTHWQKWGNRSVGWSILIITTLGLVLMGLWQFLSRYDSGDVDHAVYACAFWNLEHGRTCYSIVEFSIFGVHANYTLVSWLPVHFLAGEIGIKIGKYLCLLAGIGLLVRRDWLSRELAAWSAIALMLSPPIASQFFFGFHPEFLAAPFLVLALIAYREEKLGYFLFYAAFMTYTKEPFAMVVGGVVLLALVERRSWKWFILPVVMCTIMMGLYWFVIMRHFSPEGNHLQNFMPPSIKSLGGIFFRRHTFFYGLHLAIPFLPLMLTLPRRYLLLPLPLFLFYSVMDISTHDLWRHYAFPFAFLCMAGLVLRKEDSAVDGSIPRLDGRILLACAVMSGLSSPLWRTVFFVPLEYPTRALEVAKIHSLVPEGASVMVNGQFTTQFAARRRMMDWTYKVKPLEDFDYIVIDETFQPNWLDKKSELESDIETLSKSSNWTTEYKQGGLYLFQKKPH
jgi:hypothetical protein